GARARHGDLSHDVGAGHRAGAAVPLGQHRQRCGRGTRTRQRRRAGATPSAQLRHVPARDRALREGARRTDAAGCDPADDVLAGRGMVGEGAWADVVVFDLETLADRATYDEPTLFPDGIDYVIVNGSVVVDHGRHTGARPGHVLYGPGRSRSN